MRVANEFINCVGFIGFVNDRQDFVPYGTGFCVLWTAQNLGVPHIVTALHVIEKIPGDQVWVRVIREGGGFHLFALPKSAFAVHPNHAPDRTYIDVAVCTLPIVVPSDPITWIRETDFMSEEIIAAKGVGIGDEVVIPGMLFAHFGTTKNLPIARIGNIAAMPDEPVPFRYGKAHAYLVEVRSIDGLSGSPVFVHMGARPPTYRIGRTPPQQMHYLLGLVHGHYSVRSSEELVSVNSTAPYGDMNTGISIVIPASVIIDIIELPDNQRNRNEWATAQHQKQQAGTNIF